MSAHVTHHTQKQKSAINFLLIWNAPRNFSNNIIFQNTRHITRFSFGVFNSAKCVKFFKFVLFANEKWMDICSECKFYSFEHIYLFLMKKNQSRQSNERYCSDLEIKSLLKYILHAKALATLKPARTIERCRRQHHRS